MARIEIMNPAMLRQMRRSCKLAAETLLMVGDELHAGITTDDIDVLVHNFIVEHDAYPSPLNYRDFPKSVCTSVNDVICHGIPDETVLRDGDIINVDVTTLLPADDGFHGDCSATFYIGEPSGDARHVTETARRCLELGIAEVKHGARLGDIGAAVEEYALAQDCSVVRDYVGHGIGREFHMAPQVQHFGKRGKGKRIKQGMVFTIEPMINLGAHDTELQADNWTVRTRDRTLSAQFEHTVLVTATGVDVLTVRDRMLRGSEDVPCADLGALSSPIAWQARQQAV